MPYTKTAELPESVRKNLPEHAQHIFLEAFNSAYDEYAKPQDRREKDESREEVAFKVAWSAVKKEYEKGESGRWVNPLAAILLRRWQVSEMAKNPRLNVASRYYFYPWRFVINQLRQTQAQSLMLPL